MPKPIARWNPARDVWETETTGLFCEHSDVFSETWPSSGTTVAGTAYEHPTSVRHTDDSASSSLLQTPSVSDATGGHLTRGGERSDELLLPGQALSLLPTQTTEDHGHDAPNRSGGASLSTAFVMDLLPTPRATDGTKGGPNQRGSSGDLMLPSAVQLLPTPTAQAAKHAADGRGEGTLDDFNLWSVVTRIGASTNPRFADGKPSPDAQPPHLLSPDLEADSA